MRRLLRLPQREFDKRSVELVQLCDRAVRISMYHFSEIASRIPTDDRGNFRLGALLNELQATNFSNRREQHPSRVVSVSDQHRNISSGASFVDNSNLMISPGKITKT